MTLYACFPVELMHYFFSAVALGAKFPECSGRDRRGWLITAMSCNLFGQGRMCWGIAGCRLFDRSLSSWPPSCNGHSSRCVSWTPEVYFLYFCLELVEIYINVILLSFKHCLFVTSMLKKINLSSRVKSPTRFFFEMDRFINMFDTKNKH